MNDNNKNLEKQIDELKQELKIKDATQAEYKSKEEVHNKVIKEVSGTLAKYEAKNQSFEVKNKTLKNNFKHMIKEIEKKDVTIKLPEETVSERPRVQRE